MNMEKMAASAALPKTITVVVNDAVLSTSFNAFADCIVRAAIERIRAEIKAVLAPSPERLALDLVARSSSPTRYRGVFPPAEAPSGRLILSTLDCFDFRNMAGAVSRTRAAIVALILCANGPCSTRRLFTHMKRYATFSTVKNSQTAYDYASLLVRAGLVRNIEPGRYARALWEFCGGSETASADGIANAIRGFSDAKWREIADLERAR